MFSEIEPRIVWLLGSPRSGSTWLLQLLGRLTGGATVREPLIGAHLGLSLGGLLGLPVPDDPVLSDAMGDRAPYFFSRESAEAWRPALRTLLCERFAWEARRHETLTGRPADPIVVKDPWGSVGAELLCETMPESRLLFLVRDGRDVVDSLLDGATEGWISDAYGVQVTDRARALREMALFWVRCTEAVQRAFDRHPAVTADGHLRGAVCRHRVRTRTHRQMARTRRRPHRGRARTPVLGTSRGSERAGQVLRSGRSLWREHFTAAEQDLLEELMGPTLMGKYPSTGTPSALPDDMA